MVPRGTGPQQEADMLELNVLDALVAAGQALMVASLIYFFYLVIMHGDLLRHANEEGGPETPAALCRGEPEHGSPGNVVDPIAANSARMARAAR